MAQKSFSSLTIAIALVFISALPGFGTDKIDKTVEATLNGLNIVLDRNTGSILKMSYPGVGTILDSKPENAGIIDLAYPIKEFEVLRLASRFSQDAQISVYPDSVVIFWDKLGMSRDNFKVDGNVSATVKLAAAADGKSIIMTAKVVNLSGTDVR